VNTTKEKITRVKEAILLADEKSSLKDIIFSDKVAFNGIRMLFSTNAAGAELQVNESTKHVFSGIFSKDRLLAYSDTIHDEMEAGQSIIAYKRRALFDTNLISRLPEYFEKKDFSSKEKVKDVLELVKTVYGGGFDYSFAMLENLREFIKDNNPNPVNKVAAAKYFDNLIRGTHKSTSNKTDTLEQYYEEAELSWLEFRASKYAWSLIDRRDLIYAVMLKTYCICWTSNIITIENALNELVDYCINKFDVLPLKELYFAWKVILGFSVGHFTPVFDEPQLKTPKSKSIKRINALSWDLFIFRFLETLLTEEKGNCFYIPSITTLDKGLLDTISGCPLKAMISFEHINQVETIFEDSHLFHQCLDSSLTVKQKNYLSDLERDIKGNIKLRHFVSLAISDSEKCLNQLL